MENNEDIKIVEELLKLYSVCDFETEYVEPEEKDIQAIENLLIRLKELEEEKRHTKYLLNDRKFFSEWYIGEIILCEDIKDLLERE